MKRLIISITMAIALVAVMVPAALADVQQNDTQQMQVTYGTEDMVWEQEVMETGVLPPTITLMTFGGPVSFPPAHPAESCYRTEVSFPNGEAGAVREVGANTVLVVPGASNYVSEDNLLPIVTVALTELVNAPPAPNTPLMAVIVYDWDDFNVGYEFASVGDQSMMTKNQDAYVWITNMGGVDYYNVLSSSSDGYRVIISDISDLDITDSEGTCTGTYEAAQLDFYKQADNPATLGVTETEYLESSEWWPTADRHMSSIKSDNPWAYNLPESQEYKTSDPCPPIPEIATIILMAVGLVGLGAFVLIRRRQVATMA